MGTFNDRRVEPSDGLEISDLTLSVVVGCVSSGFTGSPGFTGWFGMREPGLMKLPSNSFSRTLISVSHLQEAAPIQPGVSARAGKPLCFGRGTPLRCVATSVSAAH